MPQRRSSVGGDLGAGQAKHVYGTMLECAVRVGPEWLAAALYVQTNGWTEAGDDD